jgi:hypothetical protein
MRPKRKEEYKVIKINGKSYREHRHLMEKHLGRKLGPDETIHHINGNKKDNRLSNLKVINRSEHSKLYNPPAKMVKLKCNSCKKSYDMREKLYVWKKKNGQKYFFCSHKCSCIEIKYLELNNRISNLLKNGMTGYEISQKLGIPKVTIYYRIKKFNL